MSGPLAVLFLVLIGPLAGPATAHVAKGVETDSTWWLSPKDQRHEAKLVRDLGARWVRLKVSWADLEPRRGHLDPWWLRKTDRAISTTRRARSRVLLVVGGAPPWASGTTDRNAPPLDPREYARFLGVLTHRYATQVSAWEVWNEPNAKRFWGGARDPAAYARLLRAAAPVIHSAGGTVVFGGLSLNDYDFLGAALHASPQLGRYFDVMAVHPYTPGLGPRVERRAADGRLSADTFRAYSEVRRVLARHGIHKPLWVTEFGWSTTSASSPEGLLSGVDEVVQATYLRQAFEVLDRDRIAVAIVYSLRNNWWAHDANTWEDQLGLVRTDWTPKLAYQTFKRIR